MSNCTLGYVYGLALFTLVCGGSPAAAVTISPILIELTQQKNVASIRVLNNSDEAMTFQAETLSWRQTGGEDRYAQTQDLLVAPPIARIAPNTIQIFRVTLRKSAPSDAEHAYRLVLEDITTETAGEQGVIKMRFRHNLPLFSTPRQSAIVNSTWSRCVAPTGKACVQLENQGNRRIRLSNVAVEGSGWRKDLKGGATVLAGASRQWMFDLRTNQFADSREIRVTVTSDVGDIGKAVRLSEPTP